MDNPLLGNLKRTVICSVIFVDIVEYSKKTVAKQLALKGWLNELLSQALQNFSPDDRIILDTGDGAALCFPGDPEEALFIANGLRVALVEQDYPEFALRIGIHLGPVKIVKDINRRPNIIGDGINVAQRVMSFAAPNQILVSRAYYEVVSCLAEEYAQLFHYRGVHKDKHVREHEIYEVKVSGMGKVTARESESFQVPALCEEPLAVIHESTPVQGDFDNQSLTTLIKQLSRYLGPIATVMVKRAAKKASNGEDLVSMLAESIPIPEQRKVFLHEVSANLLGSRGSAKIEITSASPAQVNPSAQRTDGIPAALTAETLARAEHSLVQYIGPMAKILVHKTAKSAQGPNELIAALAETIDNERDRAAFLAAAKKDFGLS